MPGKAQDLFDQLASLLIVDATRPGDQHVEIAHGFAAAAQRPRRRDLLDALDVLQVLGQLLRRAIGFVQQEAAGDAAIVLDRLQDLLLALFAQARQLAQLALARQLLHAGEVAYLKGAPHAARWSSAPAPESSAAPACWADISAAVPDAGASLPSRHSSWMLAAIPLPMPGISSSFFGSSSSSETCCGCASSASAARR